jgi:hypothetical protein
VQDFGEAQGILQQLTTKEEFISRLGLVRPDSF